MADTKIYPVSCVTICAICDYTFVIGATLRSVTEIAPKSPFQCVNRSSIRYDCRAGVKAFRYTVNKVLLEKHVKCTLDSKFNSLQRKVELSDISPNLKGFELPVNLSDPRRDISDDCFSI